MLGRREEKKNRANSAQLGGISKSTGCPTSIFSVVKRIISSLDNVDFGNLRKFHTSSGKQTNPIRALQTIDPFDFMDCRNRRFCRRNEFEASAEHFPAYERINSLASTFATPYLAMHNVCV